MLLVVVGCCWAVMICCHTSRHCQRRGHWFLYEKKKGGRSRVIWLTSTLSVFCGCCVSFVHCCPPCRWWQHGLLLLWKKERRGVMPLTSTLPIHHCCLPCCWQQSGPCFLCEKRRGGGLTCCSPRCYPLFVIVVYHCHPLLVATSPTPGICVKEISHGGRWPCSPKLVISICRYLVSFMNCNGLSLSSFICSCLPPPASHVNKGEGRGVILLTCPLSAIVLHCLSLSCVVVVYLLWVVTSPASCVKKGKGDRRHSPGLMWTVTTSCQVVFNVCHWNGICWWPSNVVLPCCHCHWDA